MKYLVVLLLVGCASIGNQGMSADQLKAAAADKSFSAICQTISGVWGTEKFVYANVDKGSVPNGSINVSPDCVVTMSNTQLLRSTTPITTTIPLTVPITITH